MSIDYKTFNEIIISLINNIHTTLPEADIKEGTFLRDVIIDPAANEISNVYNNLLKTDLAQSPLTATGADLDKLASNYFITRKTGTVSTGNIRFYIAGTNVPAPTNSSSNMPGITIPVGTILVTQGSLTYPSLQFKTLSTIRIPEDTIWNLPKDGTGFAYVDVLCESVDNGSAMNIGPYEIVSTANSIISGIQNVTNVSSFSGGSDAETDISLALRIKLAITGSNIGTKNGYLSYILRQPQVLDALIVGAGDERMQRDLDENGNHIGGKVDIYVRTNSVTQGSFEYVVGSQFNSIEISENTYPEACPVNSITSIISERVINNEPIYITYVNAGDYELENHSNNKGSYYVDIPWDFNSKTTLVDQQYYPFPDGVTTTEIMRLKTKLDNELQKALAYNAFLNFSYKIKWDFIQDTNIMDPNIMLLNFGKYIDDNYYLLHINQNTNDGIMLAGRTFVKSNNKLYSRIYVSPDYKLAKSTNELAGSVKSVDRIEWMSTNVPIKNDKLYIKYIANSGIKDLQESLEPNRILTADVLIKAAKTRDIEIKLDVKCEASTDPQVLYKNISDSLSLYVNQKPLGGNVDESDIIYLVKGLDGVKTISMDTIGLGTIGSKYSQTVKCEPDEYLYLKNLILNVVNENLI